jgi:uridine kinase
LIRFWGNADVSLDKTLLDLLFTIIFVVGLTLSVKILNDSIRQEDVFGISKKPLAIAIAGDSGVGKDTLSESLSKAFGQEFTTVLHGDDYHLHERGDASWRTTTHLDPEENNLDEWSRNFRKSINREKVMARHYDHSNGRFTLPRKVPPNDFVILNGLHSHSLPYSEGVDLKVFLSMDEALRVDLKMQRDSKVRGHQDRIDVLQAIEDRKNQYEMFVEPQKNGANLLIHLSRISIDPLRLSVSIRTPNQSLVREIYRVTNSLSSVPSKLERTDDGNLWLHVEADELTSSENFELLSNLVPRYEKLLTETRILDSGVSGFMSVACLAALASQRVNKYANS